MDEKQELSLPLNRKPFRLRAREGWASFLEGEGELWALMEGGGQGEQLAELCARLLSPALSSPAFELGFNGEKYELILTPEGHRPRLFQLDFFRKQAPPELLERWNILVGRSRSGQFTLQMCGKEIDLGDVQVWPERTEDGLGLELYCGKLADADPRDRYSMLNILLDQAIGELAAMRYVDYLDELESPGEEPSIPLDQLADFIRLEADPEGWTRSDDPEWAAGRYLAYRGEPSEEEEFALRGDVFAGVTCCVPLLSGFFQGDSFYMDLLQEDGVVPGFFYYPLDGVEDCLDLRDKLEQSISGRAGPGVVTFTGGATGTALGYLDFIAWDLKVLLDTAVEVFGESPMEWAAFHTFRHNAEGIGLK